MDIKCRVCLATTEAKMYHTLLTIFPEYLKSNLTVLNLLEIVTSTKLDMKHGYPNSICTACLRQLKECYNFTEQFKNNQSWLQENFSEISCIKEDYDELMEESNNRSIDEEHIIVKVEAIDESFSRPVILDMDGNDIIQTDWKTKNLKKSVKKPKPKTKLNVGKKINNGKKRTRTLTRPLKRNESGLIVMSIEDIITDRSVKNTEELEYIENAANTTAEIPDSTDSFKEEEEEQEEEIIIHTDHTYQKQFENEELEKHSSKEVNLEKINDLQDDVCVMSIKDVLNSPTKLKKRKTKGIITQSTDLIKNLEKKTETRRNRKKKSEIKEEESLEEVKYICDICHNVYDSYKKMIGHKYMVHVSGFEEKLKCPICDLICKTRSSLTHHKRKHKGRQATCDECDKAYFTTTQLKDHKKRVHSGGVPAKYLCNECGKRFKFHNALKYHLVSIHQVGSKQYMCRYCGFTCVQQSYLKRHERCHTGERPYQCKFCPRRFKGTAELLSHQLNHEGKTRYKCRYCGKGFIQSWNMKVHWLQHRGDIECQICDRAFIDDNVLTFHYFHHHKIRDGAYREASENEGTNSNDEQDEQENTLFYKFTGDSEPLGDYMFDSE